MTTWSRLLRTGFVAAALALAPTGADADHVGGLNPQGDNFLALRAGPGTTYRTLRQMGPDTVVRVIARRGDWLKVELEDGEQGWAFGRYILAGDPPGAEPEVEDGAEDETELAPVPLPAGEDWTAWVNDRFGTGLEYPADLFEMDEAPENDDGRSFTTPGGVGRFFVYGAYNVFEWTIEELLEDDLASGDYDRVTYRRSGEDWYVLSGYRGSDIYYRKVILAGDFIHMFEASYARGQRRLFDPVVARMAQSLSAGPGDDWIAPGPEAEVVIEEAPLDEVEVAPAAPEIGPDDWMAPPEEVLFAGTATDLFLPHQAHGGVFEQHARYEDGALIVDVPPDNGWGKVGLLTNDPVVWLDAFHGDAEVRIAYEFDPERTDGFGVSLAETGWGGVMGNDPAWPCVRFYWIRQADGSAASEMHVDPHGTDDYDKLVLPGEAPREVTFVLRPGWVSVELDGKEVVARPWKNVAEGAGSRLYAFSHAAAAGLPARMALRAIRVSRRAATIEAVAAEPAPGVEPLPVETLFDGAPTPAFEPAAVAGGNFEGFARYAADGLEVDVPAGNSWAKTGFISAEPLLALDDRNALTPTRLTLGFDPGRTRTVVLALAGDKVVEMWPGHNAWFSFLRPEGQDFVEMGIHSSPYHNHSRKLPAEWVDRYWDGALIYEFVDGRTCLRLVAGPSVCADMPVNAGYAYYATILAHAWQENAPAALVLRRITRGLATPPGMTMADRWYFVDDADFDPGQFLGELGSTLP